MSELIFQGLSVNTSLSSSPEIWKLNPTPWVLKELRSQIMNQLSWQNKTSLRQIGQKKEKGEKRAHKKELPISQNTEAII